MSDLHSEERNWTRRQVLRAGALGAAALATSDPLRAIAQQAARRAKSQGPKKARSVIQIWMWGGPAHTDTFDPKPEAGPDYTGPLTQTVETNVKGIRLGQLLPECAKVADKFSILRGMTHGVFSHETAAYMVQTGWPAGGRIVHPSAGAVVSHELGYGKGYKGLIPPYVVVTRPQGRFSEAGFLGTRYKPFATGGDPARTPFLVEGIASPGLTRSRQEKRKKLLAEVDRFAEELADDPRVRDFKDAQEKAYDLILGETGKVFDLSTEKKELRERYGNSSFGQSCLLARRLVEQGVPYITINYGGWDTHKKHFEEMRRKLPQLDRGLSTLLADLDAHGLLDECIVWWGGEFGRGPKVQWDAPWNGGRSHYGRAFSSVLAGGGFRGGQVVGATDAKGEHVIERKIYPWDLLGTLYAQLGIDPKLQLRHPQGQLVPVLPGADQKLEQGGLLKEII